MSLGFSKRIIRLNHVMGRTGLGRSSIYARVKEKTFPTPVSIGPRSVGWVESEIEAWIDAQISERDGALK